MRNQLQEIRVHYIEFPQAASRLKKKFNWSFLLFWTSYFGFLFGGAVYLLLYLAI